MKIEMIKEGPIDGVQKKPGDVVEVGDQLAGRLIEFRFAKAYQESKEAVSQDAPRKAEKTAPKTAEKKLQAKKPRTRARSKP